MTDFYSQNRCACSTRSHGPLLCAFCLSFHFKKGDKALFDNYRPISTLPSIYKIFERIIFDQMHAYFTSRALYYNGQYGFIKKPLHRISHFRTHR